MIFNFFSGSVNVEKVPTCPKCKKTFDDETSQGWTPGNNVTNNISPRSDQKVGTWLVLVDGTNPGVVSPEFTNVKTDFP